jgi:hypothetical protein
MEEIAMFYAWQVDEGAAGGPFARNNVLPSGVFRLDPLLNGEASVLALNRRYFHSRWAVEDQTDCFLVPGL